MNAFNISEWSEELDEILADDLEIEETGYYYSDWLRSIPNDRKYEEEKLPQ